MKIGIGETLREAFGDGFRYPEAEVVPAEIRALLINEVVPADPGDDFYGGNAFPAYPGSALPLFRAAGAEADSMADLSALGIYITNAVKRPKRTYEVAGEDFEASLPLLEAEFDLFPNLKAVMLMGDVAKRMFNIIAKKRSGRNVIPSGSTYKLRGEAFHFGGIRVFPSYIMTGGNLQIEKSKFEMASADIARMLELLNA
ncbi:MAG: uracil-DNA glycosylase [Lentisphaeria bacterium]|nr:uracil-DNA glycosylase [Lentisphaeria bacterium]